MSKVKTFSIFLEITKKIFFHFSNKKL